MLYWIAFVNWVKETHTIDPKRLIVATRGGAGFYYRVPEGIECYRLRTLQEIRTANTYDWLGNKSLKQVEVTDFDRELIQGASYDLRQSFEVGVNVLSPATMFQAFHGAWHGTGPVADLYNHVKFAKLPVPPWPTGVPKPTAPYTVVKLYSRATLPHTGYSCYWARRTVQRLCERGPVIVMAPPDVTDDHLTFSLADAIGRRLEHPNLTWVTDAITLDDSLAIQGALIGRAKQYVGTYGGMQQLAMLLGIPSVGFYSKWEGTLPFHLECSQRIARIMGLPFHVLRIGEEDKLREVV